MSREKTSIRRKKVVRQDQGAALKKLRGKMGQNQFAKELGVALRTYQRYESGERLVPPGLLRLAQILFGETARILDGSQHKGDATVGHMLDRILQSEGDYEIALRANIRAFYKALMDSNRVEQLEYRVAALEKKIGVAINEIRRLGGDDSLIEARMADKTT